LFLGFSFFLVTAALILMSLLFRFSVEQRLPEVGVMVAMGFTRRVIGRLWLAEGLGLALVGTLPGLWIGVAYAQGLIRGLATLWRDAVGGVPLSFHATGTGLLTGWGISMAVIAGTLALTLRGQFNRPPRALLAGELASPRIRRRSRGLGLGLVLLVASAGTAGAALLKGDGGNAGAFFGAGALALIGGVLLVSGWIARHETADTAAGVKTTTGFTLTTLAVRGITRRRSRSVSTVALLASGTFLVLAIGAFQMDATRDAGRRDSGTGGFAWIGQSALPVTVDLNADAWLEAFGLSRAELAGVNFVQARVKEGDEASCLNLDRAQRPRVVGVPAARLAELGAFRFVQTAKGRSKAEGWRLLSSTELVGPDGIPEVPALGDAASIQWALGRKMGDGVELTDDRGRRVRLRLVAGVAPSILQGSLFIDEEAFSRWFPGEAGYRFFLIDAPAGQTEAVSGKLTRALEDVGLELVPAVRRLNEFNAVQNTYLGTFQVLGGLGLLLGSAGLGVVVLRNVLERRAELGLLAAVGFRPRRLKRMVLLEHAALLAFGLLIGAGSATLAVVPELMAGARSLPVGSLALTVIGVAVFGLLTAWWGTRAALQGRLTSALRGE
ncbi:MAG: ABC transporter permease, partial [Verrucomicrobiales bacterium]|nr:ABC transporter permease [Verrucomicrobiales bacterium]